MSRKTVLRASILAAFVSAGIWGCSDMPKDLTVTQKVADNPVTVYGKVIDSQTRQGVGGATVYIKLNGAWKSTTTSTSTTISGDTGGSGDSLAGDFKFTGLPINTSIPMIVKSSSTGGYLQITSTINTPDYSPNSNGVNSEISQDLGQMPMEKGIVATIYVVDANTGNYVTMSDSTALPIYWGFGGGNGSVEDVMAAQDTTDTNKYTVTIPQTGNSTLTIPAIDVNADGAYDYQSSFTTVAGVGAANLTTTIAIAPITNATVLAQVASNIRTAGANSGGTAMNVIGAGDGLNLFFNMPVTPDSVTMTYTDNFKALTAAAVTVEMAVTTALSSDNTLLTVTPTAALTEGQTYTLNGTVTSANAGTADTVNNLATTSFTVTQTGTGTIGNTPSVTVDNLNYWTNGAVITPGDTITVANGTAFLVFPEPVWGTVRLISTTSGATTTINNGTPVAITGQAVTYHVLAASNDAATASNTRGGNMATGPVFLFDLAAAGIAPGTVADNTTAVPQSYTLGIDAYDADGNTLVIDASYQVQ